MIRLLLMLVPFLVYGQEDRIQFSINKNQPLSSYGFVVEVDYQVGRKKLDYPVIRDDKCMSFCHGYTRKWDDVLWIQKGGRMILRVQLRDSSRGGLMSRGVYMSWNDIRDGKLVFDFPDVQCDTIPFYWFEGLNPIDTYPETIHEYAAVIYGSETTSVCRHREKAVYDTPERIVDGWATSHVPIEVMRNALQQDMSGRFTGRIKQENKDSICCIRGHVRGDCMETLMGCPGPEIIDYPDSTVKCDNQCNYVICTCLRCGKEYEAGKKMECKTIWRKSSVDSVGQLVDKVGQLLGQVRNMEQRMRDVQDEINELRNRRVK